MLIGYVPSSSWAHKRCRAQNFPAPSPSPISPSLVSSWHQKTFVPASLRRRSSSQSQGHSTHSSSSMQYRSQHQHQCRQPTTSLRSCSSSRSLYGFTDTQMERYTDTQMERDIGRAFQEASNYCCSKGEALADGAERPSKRM